MIEHVVTLRFQLSEDILLADSQCILDCDGTVVTTEHDFDSREAASAYVEQTLMAFAIADTSEDRAVLTDITLSELDTFTMERRTLYTLSVTFGAA